jgi:hypothetical protein
MPLFSADRSRMVGLDGAWDMRTGRRVARLTMPQGGAVRAFSSDERLLLGQATVGQDLDAASIVAWDARTGRVVWQREQRLDWEELAQVAWPFVDEEDGQVLWVARALDPTRGAEPLIFSEACWAGPEQLPAAAVMPAGVPRHPCPELTATFHAKLRAGTLAAWFD